MTPYVITFIVMVGVFMIGCFAFKLPVGVSMLIAALCGALEGGLGTETIRMMVEGEFGYVDTSDYWLCQDFSGRSLRDPVLWML